MSDKRRIKTRESNIELLRIFSMLGVILLHYNNPSMGGAFASADKGSINFYILYFLESLCACSVNLFILISGYFMCKNNKRNLMKPLQLLVQVEVFSVLTYVLEIIFAQRSISMKSVIGTLIPSNYFVILYLTLYFISPYLNKLMEQLSSKQRRNMVALLIILFSIWPTMVDLFGEITTREWVGLRTVGAYGSQWGYSIVNFVLMYIIGAYIRLNTMEDGLIADKKSVLVKLLLCSTILMIWALSNDYIGFFTERSAWEYCNPLVIMEAVLLFVLFKQLNVRQSRFINDLAKGAFSVFLLHSFFIKQIQIQYFVLKNPIIMLLHIMISSSMIYGICWMVYKLYEKATNFLYVWLEHTIKILKKDIEI